MFKQPDNKHYGDVEIFVRIIGYFQNVSFRSFSAEVQDKAFNTELRSEAEVFFAHAIYKQQGWLMKVM